MEVRFQVDVDEQTIDERLNEIVTDRQISKLNNILYKVLFPNIPCEVCNNTWDTISPCALCNATRGISTFRI